MTSGYKAFTAGEVLTASDVNNYLMQQSVMTFGGSAARSSAIGTANFEEGMVSYLKDTDKVEAYNGTNWVSVAPTSTQGLTLISTTTFSGVSSQIVSNIFTSAYRNYFLTWESTSPASQYPNYRLTTSGTPNSTSNYSHQRFESSGAGSSSQRTTDSVFSLQTNNTRAFVATLYIFAPQVAEKTFVITHTMHINDLTFTQPVNMYANGIFNDTTQFDGIQLLPNTSTITGTLKVYGLN
jgi:hypothetical protein